MKAIVYCTNTGTSKRYAEMLSAKTGIAAYDIAACGDLAADTEIIFIGWVMAGVIQGLDTVKSKFADIKVVCAVGMMKSEKQDAALKEKNAIEGDFFSLMGAFDMNKLKGMHKMMMGMMLKMMKSKIKETNDPKADEMMKMFDEGFDMVSESELDGVVALLS